MTNIMSDTVNIEQCRDCGEKTGYIITTDNQYKNRKCPFCGTYIQWFNIELLKEVIRQNEQ